MVERTMVMIIIGDCSRFAVLDSLRKVSNWLAMVKCWHMMVMMMMVKMLAARMNVKCAITLLREATRKQRRHKASCLTSAVGTIHKYTNTKIHKYTNTQMQRWHKASCLSSSTVATKHGH